MWIRTLVAATIATAVLPAAAHGATAFAIDASATVTAPADTGLITRRGDDAIEHTFGVSATPGTDIIEVQFARGVEPQADGSLPGRPEAVSAKATDDTVDLTFGRPGRYAVIARPLRDGAAGPWSEAVYVDAFDPFDFKEAPRFTDAKGPAYRLAGRVRGPIETDARITVSIAKGKRGGKFTKLGVATTRNGGRFAFKFKTAESGDVRFRYVYGGDDKVARGRVTAAGRLIMVRI